MKQETESTVGLIENRYLQHKKVESKEEKEKKMRSGVWKTWGKRVAVGMLGLAVMGASSLSLTGCGSEAEAANGVPTVTIWGSGGQEEEKRCRQLLMPIMPILNTVKRQR